jgi:hypothetical protein
LSFWSASGGAVAGSFAAWLAILQIREIGVGGLLYGVLIFGHVSAARPHK